ncbi:MAG TPA: AAA family ATPase [Gemmatimonadales bacterium]|nr:AAA family ATPase [Gemmatimonadales bacterium]
MQITDSCPPVSPPRDSRTRRVRFAIAASVGAAALAAAGWFISVNPLQRPATPRVVPYSTLLAALAAGTVDSIAIVPGEQVLGWTPEGALRILYTSTEVEPLVARAEEAGAAIAFRSSPRGVLDYANVTIGLLILMGIAIVLRRHLGGGAGGPGTEMGDEIDSSTTFANVAGNDGAVSELKEIVSFLSSPERFQRVGARTPKGVMMYGPPGTGKTLMARAVAGEAGVPFWTISGSEVTGFIVGLGVMRIKSLFKKARKRGGVIFIDEIDALGGRRGRNQSHNEDDRTLNQLLVELDGFSPSDGVVVIAATNRPEDLDPALLRPGRFDRSVAVGLPTAPEREAILRLHATQRRVPLGATVDLERLARLMPQTSGAELANLINEAAIVAAREEAGLINWTHIESARDRLLLGKERRGFQATEREWKTVAMHEAGHALLGVLCCPDDGLHKVTIQPRGQAMGVAFFSPDGDQHLHSRRYLEGQILKGLGGRAAEEVLFGADAITSGARSDLQHVTRIAKEMVYHLGMGESSGLMVLDTQNGAASAETHALMDREVRNIIERLYARAVETARTYRTAIEALGAALLERETLDGHEALAIMTEHGLRGPSAA